MDEEALRFEAQQVLRRLGPIPVTQLANELDTDLSPRELWGLLLDEDTDGFVAFPLEGGVLCDLDDLLDGLTLTHHLSEQERADNRVVESPDLSALAMVTPDDAPRTLVLTDGRELHFDGPYLIGPEGWLPEQPVLVLRVVDGCIEVSGLDQVPEPDFSTVERLVETWQRFQDRPHPLDTSELMIETRTRYPRVLTTPQPPLDELLAQAGLAVIDHGIEFVDDDEFDDWDLDEFDDLGGLGGGLGGGRGDLDSDEYDDLDELEEHLVADHQLGEGDLEDAITLYRTLDLMEGRLAIGMMDWAGQLEQGEEPDLGRLPEVLGLDQPLDASAFEDPDGADLSEEEQRTRLLAEGFFSLMSMLDDEELAFIVDEDLIGRSSLRAMIIDVMLDLLDPQLRTSGQRANAAWLCSRVVETTGGDHAEAEAHVRRAVDLNPNHIEANLAAATYLDERGQAGAALAHLNRFDAPDMDVRREHLLRYAKRGPASAGRNEPCPCGSGRKHKVCCQRTNGWPLADRMDWVFRKLSRFLESPSMVPILTEIASEVAGLLDPSDPNADHLIALNNIALYEGGGLELMCELRSELLPADELELLRSWTSVRATLNEVVEVLPGAGLTVLDLASGERTRLHDVSLSRQVEVGRALLLWIVPTPTGPTPAGGGIHVADQRRTELLDLLDEEPDAPTLASWYASLYAPPQLRTTEGDPLVFTTLVYEVPDPPAAWAALRDHLEDDDEDRLVAIADPDGDRWIRGTVTREGTQLTVETNSAPRAAWFAELLAEVVPDAELVDEHRHPFVPGARPGGGGGGGAGVAGGGGGGGAAGPDDGDGPPEGGLDLDALDPESRAAIEEHLEAMMARHEEAWVDTELPALGGATPRQAAEDPTRRDTLLRLLDEMEERSASWSGAGRAMDIDALRRRLNL